MQIISNEDVADLYLRQQNRKYYNLRWHKRSNIRAQPFCCPMKTSGLLAICPRATVAYSATRGTLRTLDTWEQEARVPAVRPRLASWCAMAQRLRVASGPLMQRSLPCTVSAAVPTQGRVGAQQPMRATGGAGRGAGHVLSPLAG